MDRSRVRLADVLILDTASIRSRASTLPEYSVFPSPGLPSRAEHVYSRTFSGNAVRLKLLSDAPASESTPSFFDLTDVTGTVDLDTTSKCNISAVVVAFTNPNGNAPDEENYRQTPFAEVSKTLWRRHSGKGPEASALERGRHSWDFALCVPSTISDSKTGEVYPLPPSFSQKGFLQCIEFQMEVVFEQKGLFLEDYSFRITLLHFPRTSPGLPSPLRARAYREETALPGPDDDPTGWSSHKTGVILGKLFNTQTMEVEFVLALASPREYPRGYTLPLFLTLKSPNEAALDLLASPKAVLISLHRKLSHKRDLHQGIRVGEARCWILLPEGTKGPSRTLQGEIFVSRDLFPSFKSPSIALGYTVQLSLDAPGITLTSKAPILSVPVAITVSCAPGPRPISYAPAPGYLERG